MSRSRASRSLASVVALVLVFISPFSASAQDAEVDDNEVCIDLPTVDGETSALLDFYLHLTTEEVSNEEGYFHCVEWGTIESLQDALDSALTDLATCQAQGPSASGTVTCPTTLSLTEELARTAQCALARGSGLRVPSQCVCYE